MNSRLIFILPALIFVVLVGFFVWGLQEGRDPSNVPSAMIEKPIPEFDFPGEPLLERDGFSDKSMKNDKVIVVNFFASWCIPCRAEHALLTQLVEEEGITLWGINHRDKTEDAKEFLEQLGNPYERIGIDSGRGVVKWGVYGLPETLVVDREGRIRYHHRGPLVRAIIERDLLPVIRALD